MIARLRSLPALTFSGRLQSETQEELRAFLPSAPPGTAGATARSPRSGVGGRGVPLQGALQGEL